MHNDKRTSTYLLVFLWLAILLFFTKWAYSDLQLQLSEKKAYVAEIDELTKEKEKLNEIQLAMKDPKSETRLEIQRYVTDFTEDDLLNYFYGYALWSDGKFIIKSLNLNKKDVNEYGFREWIINLSVSVGDEKIIMNFLRDILSENAQYRFFVEKFDLPEKQKWRNMEVNIPLKIFYK